MGKPKCYFGIDLGTTYSVLAWIDPTNTFITPETVKISMSAAIDRNTVPLADDPWPETELGEFLSSCICFPRGGSPIVGPHAKDQLKHAGGQAMKSIKTKLGKNYSREFGGAEYTAPQLWKEVLKTLIDSAPLEIREGGLTDEVVIGVPASFEEEMVNETLEAAKLAGVKNAILLDEPYAALYDYRHQQATLAYPDGSIGIEFDSQKPKLILVFDLGGGTLDVSLHKVTLGEQNNLCIKDSVATRYTEIGGDNFDSLLADYFIEQMSGVAATSKQFVLEDAELAKIELSKRAESSPMSAQISINVPTLGSSFDLTLCEYENIVAPLLAIDFTLVSVQSDNIIYPIIDVLKKWEKKSGVIPTPDAVLLNGAMTKLHTIKKRLETFFGKNVPISDIGDPYRAVARGAAIYHYNLYD